MKKLLNIIQKIEAKHLLLTGGMSAFLGFIAVLIPNSGAAVWLFLASIMSATVFVVLIAVKMLHSVISYIFSVIKRTHSVPNHKTKRNTPLIMVGLTTLIAITSLRSQIGGGITVSVIQVCALMIILYGFGMSWTRKERRDEHMKPRTSPEHNTSNPIKKQTETTGDMKKPDAYGAILLGITVNIAYGLRKKHHLTEEQESNLVVQIMGFCFIVLMRELQDASVRHIKAVSLSARHYVQ